MSFVGALIGLLSKSLDIFLFFLGRKKPKTKADHKLNTEEARRDKVQEVYKDLKERKLDDVQEYFSNTIGNIDTLRKLREKKNNPDK